MKHSRTIIIARTALIVALYTALTYMLVGFAYGFIQIRISEALVLLPLLYPESIVGLTIGCILANIASPYGVYDITIGSLVTLVSAVLTFLVGKFIKNKPLKIILGGLPPVLLNAFILPLIWYLVAGETGYWISVLSIFISQSISIYVFGTLLFLTLDRLKTRGIKGL